MSKMNPEVKTRWVAALRSGEYRQGDGCLRNIADEFCCLGVLCDVHEVGGWHLDGGREFTYAGYDNELPPPDLKEWAGLDWQSTYVVIDGVLNTLYHHNDNGRTFAEIADAIEEQL
jgi:hypothetical protein